MTRIWDEWPLRLLGTRSVQWLKVQHVGQAFLRAYHDPALEVRELREEETISLFSSLVFDVEGSKGQ